MKKLRLDELGQGKEFRFGASKAGKNLKGTDFTLEI